ncbi:MAG: phosphonate ABC transporter, permease protein PhnE [Sphaerochaeta sp.]|uniref:phosphonate ABC transporter, permease protein PhnE n=1 Tax=Sphaerochaeta sp. TaxID=1972642 RepID=UPI003D0A09D7
MKLYDAVFKPVEYHLASGKTIQEKRSKTALIWVIFLLCTLVSIKLTGFSLSVMVKRMRFFFVMLYDMIPPDFSYMHAVWQPLWDTIKMSLLGSFIGALACIPFAVLSSTNLVQAKAVTTFFKLFLSVVRTLPTLVAALIATYLFGLGTLAGTVAIAVFTFAYCGKILYESIETCSMLSFEALEAMGCQKISAIRYAIVPQVLPSYLSTVLFCFEGNVRYASILGYVGAGGLGLILNEKIGWREYDRVGMILVALFVSVACIEWLSQYLRSKLV